MSEYYYLGIVDKNKYDEIMSLPQQDGEKTSMLMKNAIFDYCLGEVDGDVLKEFERNTTEMKVVKQNMVYALVIFSSTWRMLI